MKLLVGYGRVGARKLKGFWLWRRGTRNAALLRQMEQIGRIEAALKKNSGEI